MKFDLSPVLAGAALIFTLGTGAAMALQAGDAVGTTKNDIRQALTDQGCDVRGLESEDGVVEAYCLREGERLIVVVDESTGKIVRVGTSDNE